MDVSTAIMLLTINVIVLTVVILTVLIVAIVLIVKLNKVASNVQQTTSNVASLTEWFSPVKVFGEIAKAINSIRK
jgi:outer membrane murein-binding lipoprotein Lpp